jgi:hypothetical protein
VEKHFHERRPFETIIEFILGKNHMNVLYEVRPLRSIAAYKNTEEFMIKRSHTSVTLKDEVRLSPKSQI